MGWFWNKEEKSDVELYMEQRRKQELEEQKNAPNKYQNRTEDFGYGQSYSSDDTRQKKKYSYENMKQKSAKESKWKNKKYKMSIIKVVVIIFILLQLVIPMMVIGIGSVINMAVNTTIFDKQEDRVFEKLEVPEIITLANRDFYLLEESYIDDFQGAIDGYWKNGANVCIQVDDTIYIPYERYEEKTRWYKFQLSSQEYVLDVNDGFEDVSVMTTVSNDKLNFWLFHTEYNGNYLKEPMIVKTEVSVSDYHTLLIRDEHLIIFFENAGIIQALVYDYVEQTMVGTLDVVAANYQGQEINAKKIMPGNYNVNLLDANNTLYSGVSVYLDDDVVEVMVYNERTIANVSHVIGYLGTNLLVQCGENGKVMAYDWEYDDSELRVIENEIVMPNGYEARDIAKCTGDLERFIAEMKDGTYFCKDIELSGNEMLLLEMGDLVDNSYIKEIFIESTYDIGILTVDGGLYFG